MKNLNLTRASTEKLVEIVTQWAQKPSLDIDLGAALDAYQARINGTNVNFSEAGLFIQGCSAVYDKQIKLLCKKMIEFNLVLSSLLSSGKPEENIETAKKPTEEQPKPQAEPQKKEEQSKRKKQKIESQQTECENKNVTSEERKKPTEESSEKPPETSKESEELQKLLSVPGLRSEILKSLDLSRFLADGSLEDLITKLNSDHPFSSRVDVAAIKKNLEEIFTFNNVSLSGTSWNTLCILEALLAKQKTVDFDCATEKENSALLTLKSGEIQNLTASVEVRISQNSSIGENSSVLGSVEKENGSNLVSGVEVRIFTENSDNNQTVKNESGENSAQFPISVPGIDVRILSSDLTTDFQFQCVSRGKDLRVTLVRLEDVKMGCEKEVKVQLVRLEDQKRKSGKELKVVLEKLSDSIISKHVKRKTYFSKELRVNILRLPSHILRRRKIFRLPTSFFKQEIELTKQNSEQKPKNTLKREIGGKEEVIPTKKLKTYDNHTFEDFCYSYFEKEGLAPPKPTEPPPENPTSPPDSSDPQQVPPSNPTESQQSDPTLTRKSVDARSEISFGYPDSGVSVSYHTDSEMDHPDDPGGHVASQGSRSERSMADSGRFSMLSHSEFEPMDETGLNVSAESDLGVSTTPVPQVEGAEKQGQGDTLSPLRNLFPATFADPDRAEILRRYIQPEQVESENYLKWKEYIEQKTGNETDFSVHEYGTRILNNFPTKSTREEISFRSIAENKSTADVARFFVSALHLANTYNIEICDESPGEVKPDSIKLKFLSEERHHEDLDNFSVGSETEFMKQVTSVSTPKSPALPEILDSIPSTSSCNIWKDSSNLFCKNRAKKRRSLDYSY